MSKTSVIKIILATVAFVLVFTFLQRLFTPKYASYALEGNLISEYYQSSMDQDVIMLGDCEVYSNFSTISLWEDYGITSFIRGSPQQLVWHSYYLLEDTLRHAREKPKVVVFNVMAMQYDRPASDSEPYNRLTLDGMRLSPVKYRAYKAARLEDEDFLSYVFPLLRFKENWKELSSEDFEFFFGNPRVSINGFMVRSDVVPVSFIPTPILRGNYDFGEKPMHYLQKMVELTKKHDIPLVLVKAPILFPHWFPKWDEQIIDFAEANDLLYINFMEHMDEIGIDWELHTFTAGQHLNVFGAELLSNYFGKILVSEFSEKLPDRRSYPGTAAYWNKMTELYYELLAVQERELAESGKINSFLIG